ncbi:SRPBCC family protein [Streptomyces sp. NPDC005322]|uniref:SRPBCC family protein n=1 Tax=Streptomyces sp. NPDC005322 TaxID=3157032 RepID=UPI0033A25350
MAEAKLPTGRLKKEAQGLLTALGQKALSSVTSLGKAGERGGLDIPVKPVVKKGLDEVKEKAVDKVKEKTIDKAKEVMGLGSDKGGKGGKKLKVTNIVEQIDVGAPLSLTYNLWTEWENFPSYMKKVEDVQNDDEIESDWKAQVWWSHREWRAEIIEQVPDKRIIWTSRGAKGHVDGTVTFHELSPELTRILFVLEYWPQGFFEHTGNLWRAQGRRARLEIKHFRRHLMRVVLLNPDEVVGWRGVIHDGEVVEEDEREEGGEEGPEGEEEEPEEEEEEPGDEYDEEEYEEEEEPRRRRSRR